MRHWCAIAIACLLYAVDLSAQVKLLSRRPTAVAAAFSPTDVSGIVAWWKADSLSLNDGDPIETWTDSGPHGLNLLAVVGGATRPTFKTSQLNGQPCVWFATADWMSNNAVAAPFCGEDIPMTAFTVLRFDGASVADECPWAFNTNAAAVRRTKRWFREADDGRMYYFSDDGSALKLLSTYLLAEDTNWFLSTLMISNGVVAYGWTNTTTNLFSVTDANNGGISANNFYIGAAFTYNSIGMISTSRIAELIFYSNNVSGADRSNIWSYLNSKYSLWSP